MSLILFTAPTPDGYKVSIALAEMGLGYTVQPLDLTKGEQKRAEFLKLNPNGKVPCLIDNDFAVMESGAILLWLAEKSGQLLPSHRQGRSEALQWLMRTLLCVLAPKAPMPLTTLSTTPAKSTVSSVHWATSFACARN